MSHSQGCGCSKEHKECGNEANLFKAIDRTKVVCKNEAVPDSGANPIKPWDLRRDTSKLLNSQDDPELILFVPFTCLVKLTSFCIIASRRKEPSQVRIWTNREDIEFDTHVKPMKVVEMQPDSDGLLWYPLGGKLTNVSSVTLHIRGDLEDLELIYLGFKGEATEHVRQAIKGVVYEARPVPEDHTTSSKDSVDRPIQ